MTAIDRRVVEMGFDNKQFETGVQTSVKSLDTLKKGLNLDESARSLTNLASVGKSFSLGSIADGVNNISSKFSALGVIGFTVLQNLTNSVITFAESIGKAVLGIDSMKAGFGEYEQGLTAFQTILANTKTAGATTEDINKALADLNKYANLTIYSFGDMTSAISQFTSQGVKLGDSVAAIKGIYNVMALTGGDASKAKNLIYQLSQAIAGGTVRLMDWNSIVNSGIGGPDFQNQLMQTARIHGVAVDAMVKKAGSFRESLQEGWLSSAILLETLQQYTGDLGAEQLKSMGYTDAQIKQIQELGVTANESATKMKSFTQLMETLKSNTVTSWATSFKLIVGDLDEASKLWTYIGGEIGNVLQASADARNALITGWKDLGGRDSLVRSLKNAFQTVLDVIKPVKEAFREIFPPITAQQVFNLTKGLEALTEKFKVNAETASELKRTFKGVFAIFDIAKYIITQLVTQFARLTGAVMPSGSSILDFTAKIGDWLLNLRDAIKYGDLFGKTFDKIKNFLDPAKEAFNSFLITIGPVFDKIKTFFTGIKDFLVNSFRNVDMSGINTFAKKLNVRFAPLTTLFEGVGKVITWLWAIFLKVAPFFGKLIGIIAEGVGTFATKIVDGLTNLDYNNLFDGLNGGLIAALILAIKKFIDKGSGAFSGISGILSSVQGSLQAWQSSLKAKTLMTIALAIGILAVSIIALSMVDSKKLTVALTAVTVMFGQLLASMAMFDKIKGSKGTGMGTATAQLLAISVAILILSIAVKKLSQLNAKQLIKGLVGVGVILTELALFLKVTDINGSAIGKSVGLLILAGALLVLSTAVKKFGEIKTETLKQGLAGIGLILAELALFVNLTGNSKNVIATAVGLTIIGAAMLIFAEAVNRMGAMSWEQIGKGLATIGGSLLLVTAAVNLMPKDMLLKAIALTVVAASLVILAQAVIMMGNMSWEQIGKGLATMGGALLIVAASVEMMPKDMLLTGLALVVVASGLVILSKALTNMAGMSWDEVGKGLVVLSGSLLILATATYAMQGALPGAAAILIVSGALAILAPALKMLGSMSLEEIGLSLLALTGVFAILGLAGIALVEAIPGLLGLAGAIFLIGLAALAVGAGILAFSAGLAALAVSGAAGAAALVVIITSIVSLLPTIAIKVGEALIALVAVIATGAPAITEAFKTILLSLIDLIVQVIPPLLVALGVLIVSLTAMLVAAVPQFVEGVLVIIQSILQSIADHLPEILAAGWSILISLLTGLRNNIQQVVVLTIEIITKFIDGVASQQKKIIQSGINLMISFIDGMADGIRNNTDRMIKSVKNLASAIIEGLIKGLLAGDISIAKAMWDLGQSALASLKAAFESKSPSKATERIGKYAGQGLVNGLVSYVDAVSSTAKELGNSAVSGLGDVVSRISDSLSGNLDMNPTIRPVLDLSDITTGGKQIDKLLGSKEFNVTATVNKLAPIVTDMQASKNVETQINQPAAGTSVSLVQNNYSPKSLSRLDIYRQTKSLISTAKGLTGA